MKEMKPPTFSTNVLTRNFAEQHAQILSSLADQIPLVDYSSEEILAEGKPGRPFYGKWERSLVFQDDKTQEIIGFIAGYERQADGTKKYPEPSIYVSELAVAVDMQGNGYGRKLIQAFLDHNAKIGMKKFPNSRLRFSIQTNSDKDLNGHVISLYKSFGFQKIATKEYDNRTDLVLVKIVN